MQVNTKTGLEIDGFRRHTDAFRRPVHTPLTYPPCGKGFVLGRFWRPSIFILVALRLQAAARVAHNVEAETRAYEIRMRAARKAGALSKKIEKAQGQRNDLGTSGDRPQKSKVLEEAGIAPRTASDWERLNSLDAGRCARRTMCARRSPVMALKSNNLLDLSLPVAGRCARGGCLAIKGSVTI